MLTRARTGAGVFRTIFYLPALAPPVAATLGFVYLLNPATGPVNIGLEKLGIEGPLWFNSPEWSKPSLTLLAHVGRRQHHDHLPRRDPRRAEAPARVGRARRRERRSSAALGDAADDQPGDPLRGRARRDPGAAVLHAGVRRRVDRSRPGLAGGHGRARSSRATPRARRSSTPSSSTTTASASSTWATPRRWRCCCSPSRSRSRCDHPQLAALGALPGSGAVTATVATPARAPEAAARAVRRQRFLISVAEHSLLIAAAIAFLAPVVFITLTALMTTTRRSRRSSGRSRSSGATSPRSSTSRRSGAGRSTR